MKSDYRLIVASEDEARLKRRSFALKYGVNSIGRASCNEVILRDMRISRVHCNLCINNDQITIFDHSNNGTEVNQLLNFCNAMELKANDKIKIGPFELTLKKDEIKDTINLDEDKEASSNTME